MEISTNAGFFQSVAVCTKALCNPFIGLEKKHCLQKEVIQEMETKTTRSKSNLILKRKSKHYVLMPNKVVQKGQ